jgi:glycosyltransferase involved in cell wall biosynthesis
MSKSRKRRVLVVGDAPHLKTGFGRINGLAVKAFLEAGYEVAAVSGLTLDPPGGDIGIKLFYPEQGDVLGVIAASKAITDFDPDVVYHTGEPGTLTAFSRVVPARLPLVAYVPIEGEPIASHDWRNILSAATVFTCSQYGAKILERDCGLKDVPWVYHGVDHDVFKVNGRRDMVRKITGWTDKFVIMTVATNVRRKQHPRLFEAVSILKHRYHQRDIVLYDHTVPFDGYWLEGWHLPEIAASMDIHQEVVFNPAMTKNNDSIPETAQYDGLGLVDLYNAADLFVLPSQVEGFGLPIAEAMACGLPVMVTKYAAGWEVASPAGIPIPVKDWEVHKSGTRYANADVEAMAKEILRFRRNPREAIRRADLGLQRVRDFRWEGYTETLIGTTERAIAEKAATQEIQAGSTEEPEIQT